MPERPPFLSHALATGFFTGYVPWASGTVGAFLGASIFYIIPGFESPAVLASAVVVFTILGAYASNQVVASTGHQLTSSATFAKNLFQKDTQRHPDPSIIIIDEIVGMWVSVLFLPKDIAAIAIAFLAFRFFDIVKPFPIRQSEAFPRGWGIMLDDVVAGAYACLATHAAVGLFNYSFHAWGMWD